MAKKKEEPKPRAEKYEEKVKFEGTLEQMIKMAGNTKVADRKTTNEKIDN